jgi:superfamily II DNA/RNA helicase
MEIDDEDDLFGDEAEGDYGSNGLTPSVDLKDLTVEERFKLTECAQALEEGLREGPGADPKWARIRRYLIDESWADDGCILFSQYYDTARWVAERIKESLPGSIIGLYAGSGKSGIYEQGSLLKRDREDIKAMVKRGRIKILVGTDAASEGLNMQSLGTLINVDLPWNPTRLEQRKGRIQRIGQSRSAVRILNLRYSPSVEQKVHEALSERLKKIKDMFGQIPDVLSDAWVDIALGDIERANKRLDTLPPFHAFDARYGRIEDQEGWDECERVLNRIEKLEELRKGWCA